MMSKLPDFVEPGLRKLGTEVGGEQLEQRPGDDVPEKKLCCGELLGLIVGGGGPLDLRGAGEREILPGRA